MEVLMWIQMCFTCTLKVQVYDVSDAVGITAAEKSYRLQPLGCKHLAVWPARRPPPISPEDARLCQVWLDKAVRSRGEEEAGLCQFLHPEKAFPHHFPEAPTGQFL